MYQRIYSRHISYLYFNSLYLKLLVSQSKLSVIRKDTLKYKMSELNFDFEIPRVDSRRTCFYKIKIRKIFCNVYESIKCLSENKHFEDNIILEILSNFNGSNTFGTMKISSRQGKFEPLRVDNSARSGGIIRISLIFCNMELCCGYLLESLHRGNSNKYT